MFSLGPDVDTNRRIELPDEETKRRVLHLTCCLLPKSHRDCMEILFSFLNWTASFSHIDEESGSKMDIHNLSTVITPNILYSKNKEFGMDDSFLAIEAVHTLIEYNERMCEVRVPGIHRVTRLLTCRIGSGGSPVHSQ